MKKNFFLLTATLIVTLFIIEIVLDSTLGDKNKKNLAYNRYMLFSEGNVFQNVGRIFKYHANKKITSRTFYDIEDSFIEEYNYTIQTNNYGLVQKNNIKKKKKSIIFLGDSFTEGQGYYAWIDKFNGSYKHYQVINGGILGTGFKQFELLERHISNDYNIKKVIVLYLGDDLRRDLFNHSEQVINCLKSYLNCSGYENFYSFNPISLNDHLNFLKSQRINRNSDNKKTFKIYKRQVKKYISQLSIFFYPYQFLKNNFYESKNVKIISNLESIDNLIKKYKSNIIFVGLKQKNEITNGDSYNSIRVKKHIQKTSKLFECDFNNDLNNFYKHDGHPNQAGYKYLFECVQNILNKNYQ